MANVYTSTDPASIGTSLVQQALDRFVRYKLRAQPMFRALADARPVDQSFPGTSVVFQFWNEIPDVNPVLSETTDPDAIGVPSTTSVTVTLQEYGATILYTRKVQLVAITDVTEGLADLVAWHMRDQIDKVVSPILNGGTHVIRKNGGAIFSDMTSAGPGTLNGITKWTQASQTAGTSDQFDSRLSRLATAKLRTNKVVPRQGELYAAFIHPDVSHDLRAETGGAAWRDPHNFSGAESIWTGNIGVYEGMYYIESPRLPTVMNTAATPAKVYSTFCMGKEALAEAVGEDVGVRQGPVVDKLGRFTPLGWYGLLGWNRFREDALIRIETTSSIA